MSVLPKSLLKEVAAQVERAREFWREDREAGLAGVYIAGPLFFCGALKYSFGK